MRRITVYLAALIIALGSGCASCSDPAESNSDPWMIGEDEPDDGSTTDDMGMPTRDTGPAPRDMSTPIPSELPNCVEADTHRFESFGSDFVFAPAVANDRVFVSGSTTDDPRERLLEWTEDGFVEHHDDTSMGGMIAFDDDFVWISDVDGFVHRLDLATDELQTLIEVEVPYRSVAWNYWYEPIRRTSDGERFAWQSMGIVRVVHGLAVDQLAQDGSSSPWVRGDVVAYEFGDVAGTSIRVHHGTDFFEFGEQQSTSAWPVVTASAVFFVHDGIVRAVGHDGQNNEEVLPDRFCGPLHANDDTVVVGCAADPPASPDPGRADYLSLDATQVWAFDGATRNARQVATADGPIFAPVVSRNWIVWAEYDASLGGNPPVSGRVMVLPRGEGGQPTEVGRIGNGCPFCGAYWPPPRLVLGENTIAWNYALEDEPDMFGPRAAYGVARLRPCD